MRLEELDQAMRRRAVDPQGFLPFPLHCPLMGEKPPEPFFADLLVEIRKTMETVLNILEDPRIADDDDEIDHAQWRSAADELLRQIAKSRFEIAACSVYGRWRFVESRLRALLDDPTKNERIHKREWLRWLDGALAKSFRSFAVKVKMVEMVRTLRSRKRIATEEYPPILRRRADEQMPALDRSGEPDWENIARLSDGDENEAGHSGGR